MDNFNIPVVDLSYLDSTSNWDQLEKVKIDQIAQRFGEAVRNSGLIFLENHGVCGELVDKAFSQSLKFFQQDSKVKEKYAKLDYTHFTNHDGYAKIGMESLSNELEPREFFNFHKNFQINVKGNHDIEKAADDEFILNFKTTFINLEQQCSQLFVKLLRLLSLSLGIKELDYFTNKAKSLVDKGVESYNILRTLYYPPLASLNADQEIGNSLAVRKGLRFSEHSDWGLFTILLRDAVDGLEVRTHAGKWISAEPIPGSRSIVLFVGDLLELCTGSYYKAAVHRVLQPTNENQKNCSRQSIAYFLNLDAEAIVEPLDFNHLNGGHGDTIENVQFEPFTIHKFVERKSKAAYGPK